MLCAVCGSRQCRTKSNTAKQNLQNFYNFYIVLLILHKKANSAHEGQFCAKFYNAELQNSDIPS